ncbi:formin-like protein 5 [Argentina anserina]|uniref:formin-like protein 5 n=1 Tax=Argentina anserina TaxID=57926 RepID=UPI0021766449|nr:formin-like protein 5 [Potentilla anserina]XP_050368200.1 formin-like protein 5 [Potentilla anserina]
MTIQLQMGLMRTSRFIVLVTLLCVSALISSEERLITEEVFLTRLVDPATGRIDGDMAQLLWVHCKVDLTHLVETIQDLHLWLPEEISGSTDEISSKRQSLEENLHTLISVLHPQVKQTLSDCFRKNNLFFHVSGEESASKIWYAKYIESLCPRPVPRRNMGSELLETFAEVPSPAPGPGSSIFSPVSTPGPAPSASSIPRPLSPAAPQASFFPPVSRNSVSQPSVSPPAPGSIIQINKKTDRKPIIIAVVVTASVTFVFAAVFFLCCTKICNKQRKGRQNDESPLLSLSLSDSGGSPYKFHPSENSIKREKLEHESLELGSITRASKYQYEMYEASSYGNGSLPSPPGMPPLKPPPGRAKPLPPEPPSSFKPPPGRAAPPPTPPPPVPPPTLNPSVGASPPPPPPALGLRPPAHGPRPPAPGPPPPPAPPAAVPPPPAPPAAVPPPPAPPAAGPPPPSLPKIGVPPPRPPPSMPLGSKLARPLPFAPKRTSNAASSDGSDADGDAPKTKLKPFFWDKVLANPDQSMVWHQIKSGSFQFDENMIESLFGYNNSGDKNKNDRKKESSSQDNTPQFIQIINPKKAQNLSILLRALNVTTEEVCDAVCEGNELPSEFVQTLLKMAPTQEEEFKLRVFDGELSQLGPAERFLKGLIDIPYAFKRLEALLFMCNLQEEIITLKESFASLEVACKELRNSRLFLKLLEAVLKTGNRMNDGTFRGGAQAFKLDTLLKLADVKGTDGKTTLLHFVVQEIIRSEGVRAARAAKANRSFNSVKTDDLLEETSLYTEEHYRNLGLEKVSGLSNELENVKRASILDADNLTGTVAKLRHGLIKSREFLNTDMKNSEEESGFHETLKSFVQNADVDIRGLLEEEKRIMALVKSTGDYFHGNAGKDEGLHLFVIVRDFLIILDRVCKEVRLIPSKSTKVQRKEAPPSDPRQPPTTPSASDPRTPTTPSALDPFPDLHQRLFPAIKDRRIDNSSSDDEDP